MNVRVRELPQLLKRADAAAELGCSEKQIKVLVAAGELEERWTGVKSPRITGASLAAYIEALPDTQPGKAV